MFSAQPPCAQENRQMNAPSDKETDEVTAVHYKDYARDIRRAVNYFQSTIPDVAIRRFSCYNF